MSKVTKETIEECARNLMFELSPGQAELIAEEFDTVFDQLKFLADIPGVDSAEPMTFPYKLHRDDSDLRDDEPEEPLGVEKALANSHSKIGNQIKVPKVVSHGEADGGEE